MPSQGVRSAKRTPVPVLPRRPRRVAGRRRRGRKSRCREARRRDRQTRQPSWRASLTKASKSSSGTANRRSKGAIGVRLGFEMVFAMPPRVRTVGISKNTIPRGEDSFVRCQKGQLRSTPRRGLLPSAAVGSGKSTLNAPLWVLERPISANMRSRGEKVCL